MKSALFNIFAPIMAVGLSACGQSTNAGKNAERRAEHVKAQSQRDKDQYPAINSGTNETYSCVGPATDLPLPVKNFCETMITDDKTNFSKLYQWLCADRKTANLIEPNCPGWNGVGEEQLEHLFVLENTPLTDDSGDYYFFSAYSLKLKAEDHQEFPEILMKAHSDPETFVEQNYKLPESAVITPDKHFGIKKDNHTEELRYSMTIKSKYGDRKFDSKMKTYPVDETTNVILDHAYSGFKQFNLRNSITFSRRLDDGYIKVVVLEEKSLPDGNLHDIARRTLIETDLSRMRIYYDNSLVK